MDKLLIRGGQPLRGQITISGSKNAALPIMAASLLSEEPLRLRNLPKLADIASMRSLLEQHGVAVTPVHAVEEEAAGADFQAERIRSTTAPYEIVRKMRASVLVLGPLLAREGKATVSLPGGCAIGTRPIDLHLMGLERLGAEVSFNDGYVHAAAPNGLRGAEIVFPTISVGATENLLMAASLAQGETRLVNVAREPEIVDLAHCLQAMGADIEGAGSETIRVRGKARLHGAEHRIIPDRIEAGTYAMAAAITDGELELLDARESDLLFVIETLERCGVKVTPTNRGLQVKRANGRLAAADMETSEFPGFPTDLQAQFMALMSTADGVSNIEERIFENRFMHVPELTRMGAQIATQGACAKVTGCETLTGAPVMATDLRASVSLVLAGLAAEGRTELNRVYHLDRGYERLEEKLGACGAQIERVPA